MALFHYNLAPAGYLLLEHPDRAVGFSDYGRRFGTYLGVDRLPPFSAPLPEIEWAGVRFDIGVPPDQTPEFYALTDQWSDARFGSTGFLADRDQALRFLSGFRDCGYCLEFVYCQLAWIAGEEDRLQCYPQISEEPPGNLRTYGFDTSWPGCNHSAIFQPGIVPTNPSWRSRLNKYGLLDQYETVAQLREEYLAINGPPFDIYLVHSVQL